MEKLPIFAVLIVILSVSVLGATIQGTIYDMGLDIVPNSVVEIDTEPKQMIVAKTGEYSFNVPEGSYIIQAEYKDQEASENITVSAEGEFTLDLILLPIFEEDLLSEMEFEIGEYEEFFEPEKPGKIDMTFLMLLFIACFLILIGISVYIKKRRKKAQRAEMKEDTEKVLEFLKKQGRRALQKDIRKHLAISEAKASLLVDELVAKKKVEKIKKGRGNIVILK